MSGGTVKVNEKNVMIITKIFKEKIDSYNLDTDKIIIKKHKFSKVFGGTLNLECIKGKKSSQYQFVYQQKDQEMVKVLIQLIEEAKLPNGIIARAQGRDDILDLLENKIVIRRARKFSSPHGNSGDKEILLTSITAVQLWQHHITSDGYIQFSILGGIESAKRDWRDIFSDSVFDSFFDENTVVFKGNQASDFVSIKELILNKIENRDIEKIQINNVANKNNIDDIEYLQKLSELKDKNIITEEEFNIKKKEILGL